MTFRPPLCDEKFPVFAGRATLFDQVFLSLTATLTLVITTAGGENFLTNRRRRG